MSIFGTITSFISGIFGPAADLIDNVHTSDEERLQLKNKFAEIQAEVNTKMIDFQTKVVELENQVRLAELASSHWLAANWRPASAMFLVANIVVMGWMGNDIPDAIQNLSNIFIPGYALGRTAEKVSKARKKIEK
jgi:hypothetical protein